MDPQYYVNYKIYSKLLNYNTNRILFSQPTMGIYEKLPHESQDVCNISIYPFVTTYENSNTNITELGESTRKTDRDKQVHYFLNNSFEPLDYNFAKWFWQGNYLTRQLSKKLWCREYTLIHNEKNSKDLEKIMEKSEITNNTYWFGNGYLTAKHWYKYQGLGCFDNFMDRPILSNFICMNRLIDNDKKWRLHFLNLLNLENGIYSLLEKDPITGRSVKDILPNSVEPKQFDNIQNDSGGLVVTETTPINTSFLHIVCETLYNNHKLFLTEKTFKPIVLGQPFVLLTGPGNLEYLQSYGFKTFSEFWNEDYDNILDDNKRMQAVADIVNYIGSMSKRELINLRKKMEPTLMHNRRWFYSDFGNNCWQELKNNISRFVE